MAPRRKSQRISNKSFKTVPASSPISLRDESSDSDHPSSHAAPTARVRKDPSSVSKKQEIRSKRRNDEKSLDFSDSSREEEATPEAPSDTEITPEPKKKAKVTPERSSKMTKTKKKPRMFPGETSGTKEIPSSRKRKRITSKTASHLEKVKSFDLTKVKFRDSSFLDFDYFKKNGFFWDEWLDKLGCQSLCMLSDEVDGFCVKEFYDNLTRRSSGKLVSKVDNRKIKVTKKVLIKCFGLKNMEEEDELLNMSKNDLFKMLNDGVGSFTDDDVFINEFELLVRILHKMVHECLLPKLGSTTTVSKEDGLILLALIKDKRIDLPRMIMNHMWKHRTSFPYGSLIISLLKFKGFSLPKKSKFPLPLKKIGQNNFKKMSIYVHKKFWFSLDGGCYVHKKYRLRKITWKKVVSMLDNPVERNFEQEEEDGSSMIQGEIDDKAMEIEAKLSKVIDDKFEVLSTSLLSKMKDLLQQSSVPHQPTSDFQAEDDRMDEDEMIPAADDHSQPAVAAEEELEQAPVEATIKEVEQAPVEATVDEVEQAPVEAAVEEVEQPPVAAAVDEVQQAPSVDLQDRKHWIIVPASFWTPSNSFPNIFF